MQETDGDGTEIREKKTPRDVAEAEASYEAAGETQAQADEDIPNVEADLVAELDRPEDPARIYLEEASAWRPVSTGDVFLDAPVPGTPEADAAHNLTMVVSHPSAMRKGAPLEEFVRAAPVSCVENLSKTKWAPNRLDVFPLPLLSACVNANGFALDPDGWGARIELAGPIRSEVLDPRKRVCCLSPIGVRILLQSIVAVDTRCVVNSLLIERQISQKLEEIEWLQDWNEELLGHLDSNVDDFLVELARKAEEFEEVMKFTGPERPRSLRECLYSRDGVTQARLALQSEIEERRPS